MTNNQQLSEKIWGARDSLIDQRSDAKEESVIADLQKAIMSLSGAALQLECGRIESSLRILDNIVPGDLGHLDGWQRNVIQMAAEIKADLGDEYAIQDLAYRVEMLDQAALRAEM